MEEKSTKCDKCFLEFYLAVALTLAETKLHTNDFHKRKCIARFSFRYGGVKCGSVTLGGPGLYSRNSPETFDLLRRKLDRIVSKMFAKWALRREALPTPAIMPDRITVRSFLNEARDDVSSPTTSNFMSTMNACRNTVGALEEVSSRNFAFISTDFYIFRALKPVL